MLRPRIIPCLLVHKGGLVKTVGSRSPSTSATRSMRSRSSTRRRPTSSIVLDIDATVNGARARLQADRQSGRRVPHATVLRRRHTDGRAGQAHHRPGGREGRDQRGRDRRPRLITRIADEIGSQSVVVVLDVEEAGARQRATRCAPTTARATPSARSDRAAPRREEARRR